MRDGYAQKELCTFCSNGEGHYLDGRIEIRKWYFRELQYPIPWYVIHYLNTAGFEDLTPSDARPDFSATSSDFRMEVSSSAALNHINNFIKPKAALIDGSGEEEPFLLKGLKARAISLQKTVIELPESAEQNLMWITLLDSSSLSGKSSTLCSPTLTKSF